MKLHIILLTLTAFALSACQHTLVYTMPAPPADLMAPVAKLTPIQSYKSAVDLVPTVPKPTK